MSSIQYSHWVPKGPITVAFSCGSDSVFAAEHFIRQRREVKLLHINHGTYDSERMTEYSLGWAKTNNVPIEVVRIPSQKPKGDSWEEYWRNERLRAFYSVEGPVVTGHNLDDQVENYLFSAINGQGRLMPSSNRNIIRPFLFLTKEEMKSKTKGVWIEDPSNADVSFARNRLRHNIIPEIKKINPGINTVVKRLMIECGYGAK